jgi:predicted membrane protein
MTSRVALGAILLGAGALWLLSNAGVLDLSYQVWIGILLIAIGLAIAFTPGHHGLLTFIGILVVLAGLPALVVGDFVTGGVGDAVETPATPAEIEDYEHGVGKLTVDLTAPGLADEDLDVKAEAGIGELLVLVPRQADVTVDAHVGVGNIDALGAQQDGVDVDLKREFPGLGDQEIELELDLGLGDIRVQRR